MIEKLTRTSRTRKEIAIVAVTSSSWETFADWTALAMLLKRVMFDKMSVQKNTDNPR
jgi:hypothetical protein